MTNKLLLLTAVALIGINGCATTQQGDAYFTTSNPKNLAINAPDESAPSKKLPIYELLLAELSIRRGDNDVAVENYLTVLDQVNDSEIAERAVKIAAHAKDIDSALQAVQTWQESEPDNFKPYQIAGTLLLRQGYIDDAYDQFEQSVILRGVESRLGFSSILSILSRERNPQGILQISKKLADKYSSNAYAQFMYGSLAAKLNQSQSALDYLDKSLNIEDIREAHGLKAKLLLKLGRRNEAVVSLKAAVKNNPDNNEMRMTYARLLIDVKQYNQARIEFSKLLKHSPNDADLLYTLGLLSLEADLLDDAEKHLTQLLQSRHRRGEAIYYLGRINESKKDLPKAIDWYQQVNSGDFKFDAQIRAVKLLARMGEIDKANKELTDLKITHQNESTLVRIYLTEAAIFRDAHKYQKAMEVYDQALDRIPSNNDLLYARAITSEKVGRLDILEQDLLAILKTEPDNSNALNALGFTLASAPDRVEEAYEYVKKALELSPDEAAIVDSMGWVEYKRGNLDIAETLLRKAYSMLNDSEIAAHLVELLWVNGKRNEAKTLITDVLKSEPDSEYIKEVMQRLIP